MSRKVYDNVDLTGQRFERLVAQYRVPGTRTKWHCLCDCGNEKDIYAGYLIKHIRKSCGCLEKDNLKEISKNSTKHGMTDTILYKKWCGMKERCFNPNYKHYDRYGGRGITICPEWLGEHGFEHFSEWAYSAGYDESKHGYDQSIDRIDVNGNYEPSNCRWANQLEQSTNRSNTILVEDSDGEKLTVNQFDKKHSIDADMFSYRRFKKGFTAEQILEEWTDYLKANKGEMLTKEQASEYYGVCVETITQWVIKGRLKAKKLRNRIYIYKGQPKPVFVDRNPDGTFIKKS